MKTIVVIVDPHNLILPYPFFGATTLGTTAFNIKTLSINDIQQNNTQEKHLVLEGIGREVFMKGKYQYC